MGRQDKETVVVVKRGCTCCGTGCVLIGLVLPLATFALWTTVGAVAAISTVTAALFARGTQVALARRQNAPPRGAGPPED